MPTMNPVHWLIDTVIELYIWVVIAGGGGPKVRWL